MLHKYRLWWVNGILLLTLCGSLWGKRTSIAPTILPDALSQPLVFRGWKTSDQKLTPREQELLLPDALLLRRFQAPHGETAEIAVIAGHRKQTVHTPTFCMAGGGWETVSAQPAAIIIDGQTIEATQMVMAKQNHELVATFFFSDGSWHTNNLTLFQAHQMQTRLRGQTPVGALVRIIVPVRTSRENANQLTKEFAQAILPEVISRLQAAGR